MLDDKVEELSYVFFENIVDGILKVFCKFEDRDVVFCWS